MSPTPLLDVSKSILIASTFSIRKISKNPAIYIFNPDKSQIIKKDDIDSSFIPTTELIIEKEKSNQFLQSSKKHYGRSKNLI